MVPRPSSRFPRMLKHAHGSPLRMINHLLRSPRLKAGASRGIPVLRMVTPARAHAVVYGCRTRRELRRGRSGGSCTLAPELIMRRMKMHIRFGHRELSKSRHRMR